MKRIVVVLSAAATLVACSAPVPAPSPTPVIPPATTLLQSATPAVQTALTQLATTPAGSNIIGWVAGALSQVKTDLTSFNAALPGGGLTVDKIKGACGLDNSLHGLLQVVLPYLPPPPGINPVGLDNVLNAGIQDGCAIATGGVMPSLSQIQPIVDAFNNGVTTLGL